MKKRRSSPRRRLNESLQRRVRHDVQVTESDLRALDRDSGRFVVNKERCAIRRDRSLSLETCIAKVAQHLAGLAVLAGVIQLHGEVGLHRRWVSKQQVDVLDAELGFYRRLVNPESTTWISTSFSRPFSGDRDSPSSSLRASFLVAAVVRSVVQRVCVARWS